MRSGKSEVGFDAFEDMRQAVIRLELLRYLTLAIFLALGVRLWWLQVVNHEVYAERAEQNRIRELLIPARRGTIYDRNGKILVDSRPSYNIIVSRKDVKNFDELKELLVENLCDCASEDKAEEQQKKAEYRENLTKRLEAARFEPNYEAIVVKEQASPADVAWVMAHEYEYPELRAEEVPQRYYPHKNFAAHVLGYVGEVSRAELEKGRFSKENGYKLGDIIGKSGVERTYNEILMGRDGMRRVIVDSRGRIQAEIDRIDPIPGRNLYLTLDYEIQKVAEEQADLFLEGRGVIAVMDPNNGEMLAMVSRPDFDPNVFSQRLKEEIEALSADEEKPLFNRAIQGIYPTGSTWKIFMAVAALNEQVITVKESRLQDGGLQIGNYFMSSLSNLGRPDIHLAIVKSADGYFYRLGLKMGIERIEKWTQIFRLGQPTGIDLPNEAAGVPPSREWKAKVNPKDPKWRDYDTAAASIGQGIAITPLQVLRTVAGVAMGGQMVTPHFLLKAEAGIDRQGNWHDEIRYIDEKRFTVPMSREVHETVSKAMWGVVNENGTGGGARVEGFDVSGKTGTAQVASKERAGSKNKDHAWFVSYAPRAKPEIASVVLVENVGFGGTHAAPRAKAIYEAYYRRTRNLPMGTEVQVAKK